MTDNISEARLLALEQTIAKLQEKLANEEILTKRLELNLYNVMQDIDALERAIKSINGKD